MFQPKLLLKQKNCSSTKTSSTDNNYSTTKPTTTEMTTAQLKQIQHQITVTHQNYVRKSSKASSKLLQQ